MKSVTIDYENPPRWARNSFRWPVGNPYPNPITLARTLWAIAKGPLPRNLNSIEYLPSSCLVNEVSTEFTIAAIGDILPAPGYTVNVAQEFMDFIDDVDYLFYNLEGVPGGSSRVLNGYTHEAEVVDWLCDFFPPHKTVVTMANNHAGDCGWLEFCQQFDRLRDLGFNVVGRSDVPFINVGDNLAVASGSYWMNVSAPYVPNLQSVAKCRLDTDRFRILMPHWGKEMELFPSQGQIRRAADFTKTFDLVIGHHTHCPQPISSVGDGIVAFSMGNFIRSDTDESGWHGLAMKMTVGRENSGPLVPGRLQWSFMCQEESGSNMNVGMRDTCRFLPEVRVQRKPR